MRCPHDEGGVLCIVAWIGDQTETLIRLPFSTPGIDSDLSNRDLILMVAAVMAAVFVMMAFSLIITAVQMTYRRRLEGLKAGTAESAHSKEAD
jgi:heme/copper-type cytochrome/quinol oxidase subunit 2